MHSWLLELTPISVAGAGSPFKWQKQAKAGKTLKGEMLRAKV
jgi:hypothetical protein